MSDLKNTYQLWFPISFFIILFTVLGTYLVMKLSWSVGTKWYAFELHFNTWILILKEFINFNDNAYFDYKKYILNGEYHRDLIFHITIPFFFSLILSSCLVFRLFWVKGGRDKAIHISGPRLYKHKFAFKHAKKSLRKELKNG